MSCIDASCIESGKYARNLDPAAWHLALLGTQASVIAYMSAISFKNMPGNEAVRIKEFPVTEDPNSPVPIEKSVPMQTLAGGKRSTVAYLKNFLSTSKLLRVVALCCPETSTEVLIIAYQDLPDTKIHIIVSFRGTMGKEDVKTDLDANKVQLPYSLASQYDGQVSVAEFEDIWVHEGFLGQYMSMRHTVHEHLKDAIAMHVKADDVHKSPQWDLMVAGHSMGGALANACVFDLLSSKFAHQTRIRLVTIGAGPFGNPAFAEKLNTLMALTSDPTRHLRLVYNNDPVPAIALSLSEGGTLTFNHIWPYKHGGTLIWLGTKPGQFFDLNGTFVGGLRRSFSRFDTYHQYIFKKCFGCCSCTRRCKFNRAAHKDHGSAEYSRIVQVFSNHKKTKALEWASKPDPIFHDISSQVVPVVAGA
eukprot:gnl/MRDRNA2_/MRDRNA2_85453_c3_seq1.p1 gnl/MRDRNA2_/MRDRNA2_85453_c3~~gnl/MRDRNA2_/MRDRNA2_85453_c3_seq1.p1  ORF type:complete len:418 (+),score=35.67 gnl/MRDRNA2_/MRDRNA2_85453_c3_seq1:149-1402(+)